MQRLDFNLLQALDALLQEGSVRGAAERLNLTAPAMSHALSRLRTMLGDPLLVRAGQRLVPTPRAIALRDQVRQTVESGRSILQDRPSDAFKSLSRTFTVRANDSTISVFGASLTERLQAQAPDVRIRFAGRSEEGVGPLRDGTVDLDIGVVADVGQDEAGEQSPLSPPPGAASSSPSAGCASPAHRPDYSRDAPARRCPPSAETSIRACRAPRSRRAACRRSTPARER